MPAEKITLTFPPFPVYTVSAYRRFEEGERHLTRRFNEYVLLIVIEGVLRFTEEGQEVELGPGEWYLQRPGLLQSATRPSDKPYYYFCHFRMPNEIPDEPAPIRYRNASVKIPVRGTCDWRLYEYYFWQLENFPLLDAEAILHVQKLFLEFFRLFLETAVEDSRMLSALVREMIGFVREHYTESDLMARLSATFHYSPDYLRKRFRKETGSCPTDYQTSIRIDHARWQLNATDLSIEKIGRKVGWNDSSTFIRCFRRRMGCTPSEWRRREKDL